MADRPKTAIKQIVDRGHYLTFGLKDGVYAVWVDSHPGYQYSSSPERAARQMLDFLSKQDLMEQRRKLLPPN